MTSQERITANRANAGHSTGPRTKDGKKRVARNALQHGLAADIVRDPAILPEVERLTEAMGGVRASAERRMVACILATAQIELWRVRTARAGLIDLTAAEQAERQKTVAAAGSAADAGQREAEAIQAALPRLARLDRYERRALSRRNKALRRLQALSLWDTEPKDAAGT